MRPVVSKNSRALAACLFWACVVPIGYAEQASICYGSWENGRLEGGVQLPETGENYIAYGLATVALGRTYVHSAVNAIWIDALEELASSHPEKVFKYAETGLKEGGEFKPHKTHGNGLSMDIMVPMVNEAGESKHLPTHPFNRYGYDVELDSDGRYKNLSLDFDALGALIVALHQSALKHDHNIRRVIFDPRLQPKLFASSHGEYIQQHISIPEKRSWVRHDEHIHVDFVVPCRDAS